MKQVIIVFRGRSTAGIIKDTLKHLPAERDDIIVVAPEDDKLREPGDITPSEAIALAEKTRSVAVICNGGTTRSVMPVVIELAQNRGGSAVVFLDIQRDGMTVLGRV